MDDFTNGNSASAGVRLPGTNEDKPNEPRPLWRAAMAIADPALVQELRESAEEYRTRYSGPCLENPFPNTGEHYRRMILIDPLSGMHQSQESHFARRHAAAGYAVRVDFIRRLVAGEMELYGLQTMPALGKERTQIPVAWFDFPGLRLGWHDNTVMLTEYKFDKVTACRPSNGADTACVVKSGPGRPQYPWTKLAAIAHAVPRGNNLATAKAIHAILAKKYPEHEKISIDQIAKRLKKIYGFRIT